eukprot:TRINITY_DN1621_c0_g3_i1.p1 TRINITY_DN1621_c0_g3~~TRINITY_DN1621_c0_g3_i1.p1  ORF type:complete len:1049 (-),score=303.07 TRINITY_DN1621_c0_g3_i1:13-2919(-)
MLLNLLKEKDQWIRLSVIQIFTKLVFSQPDELNSGLAKCHGGLMVLMDVMNDSRQFVRNELLLLLIKLTKDNTEIQNFVAFQEGMDKLLSIVMTEEEPGVQTDCLRIISNVLHGNQLTQKLFTQSECLRILHQMLHSGCCAHPESSGLKFPETVLGSMVGVFGNLLSSGESGKPCTEYQDLLGKLPSFIACVSWCSFSNSVPLNVRVECLKCLSALVKNHVDNQELLCATNCPFNTIPRSPLPNTEMGLSGNCLSLLINQSFITDPSAVNLVSESVECLMNTLSGEGNRVCMSALGHAVFPPPPDPFAEPMATVIPPACKILATTIEQETKSVLLQHASPNSLSLQWRACRLLEQFFSGPDGTGREMFMRITVPAYVESSSFSHLSSSTQTEQPLFEFLMKTLAAALNKKMILLQFSLLRLLCMWARHCKAAISHILSSSANLFLFDFFSPHNFQVVTDPYSGMGSVGGMLGDPEQNAKVDAKAVAQVAALLLAICIDEGGDSKNNQHQPQSNGPGSHKGFTPAMVLETIRRRIGLHSFEEMLDTLKNSLAENLSAVDVIVSPSNGCFDGEFAQDMNDLFARFQEKIMEVYTGSGSAPQSAGDDKLVNGAIKALQVQIQELKSQLSTKNLKITELEEQVSSQSEEITSKSEETSKIISSLEEKLNIIGSSHEQELKTMKQTIDDQKIVIESLEEGNKSLQTEITLYEASSAEHAATVNRLQLQINDDQSNIQSSNSKIEDLTSQINNLQSTSVEAKNIEKSLNEKIHELQTNTEGFMSQIATLEQENAQIKTETSKIPELEEECVALKFEAKAAIDQNAWSKKETASLHDELDTLQADHEDLLVLLAQQEIERTEAESVLVEFSPMAMTEVHKRVKQRFDELEGIAISESLNSTTAENHQENNNNDNNNENGNIDNSNNNNNNSHIDNNNNTTHEGDNVGLKDGKLDINQYDEHDDEDDMNLEDIITQ